MKYLKILLILSVLSLSTVAEAKDKNHLLNLSSLNNTYYVIRHGESVPSSKKIVCGSMEEGVKPENALTEKGREEVRKSVNAWIQTNHEMIAKFAESNRLHIISSPFSRTIETANITSEILKDAFGKEFKVVQEKDLRERFFGSYEGQSNSGEAYKAVWAKDKLSEKNTDQGVESPISVQSRASKVIANLDKKSKGDFYILVAHGDTLKILQTAFQKESPSFHATEDHVKPFATAEIREMKLHSSIK